MTTLRKSKPDWWGAPGRAYLQRPRRHRKAVVLLCSVTAWSSPGREQLAEALSEAVAARVVGVVWS